MTNKRRAKDRRRRKRRKDRAYKRGSEKPPESATISANMTKRLDCKVAKVDDSLGLVFGWAIVCTEGGLPYIDTQGDHIPDASMLKATFKFAKGKRQGGDMHRTEDGTVLFMWPMTAEVAKAFDLQTDKTGLMIAMLPDDPDTLQKFRTGERTGFSIGGTRKKDTVQEIEVND
jgi:hypothetical protein